MLLIENLTKREAHILQEALKELYTLVRTDDACDTDITLEEVEALRSQLFDN